ncbi:MAG: hypothetical protein WC749_08135 [Dehalococcoidia bacterium]
MLDDRRIYPIGNEILHFVQNDTKRRAIQKLPSKTVIPGLTRNPGAFAWIPAFAGKTNGDSFLPGVFRRAESGTQNDTLDLTLH